jgi:hypothetical protein
VDGGGEGCDRDGGADDEYVKAGHGGGSLMGWPGATVCLALRAFDFGHASPFGGCLDASFE